MVAGGAGEVGEGVVRALLEAGATVVVPSRSWERLEALAARLEPGLRARLEAHELAVGTPEGAAELRRRIEARGRLDLVVASLGGWWRGGPLTEVPLETWRRILDDNLTSHFVVARTFLPLVMASAGTYVLLNGAASRIPVAGSGPVSVAASAQIMLKDVLVAETRGTAARVCTLVIDTPVRTRSRPDGGPEWLSADEVGELVLWVSSASGSEAAGANVPLDRRTLEWVRQHGWDERPAPSP
jgi:3-oxoacyl-[acyl-carrier protein] reductase